MLVEISSNEIKVYTASVVKAESPFYQRVTITREDPECSEEALPQSEGGEGTRCHRATSVGLLRKEYLERKGYSCLNCCVPADECLTVKSVGKLDAGEPHVRIDKRDGKRGHGKSACGGSSNG